MSENDNFYSFNPTMKVKIRLEHGRHWHLPDCNMAYGKNYEEFPLLDVLAGDIRPIDDFHAAYVICPGCRLRIKGFRFIVKKDGI